MGMFLLFLGVFCTGFALGVLFVCVFASNLEPPAPSDDKTFGALS